MNIKTNWIRVIIFCYIPQLSFAEPLLIDINPVKVTATRVEKNIIDIPASVSYISQEKIQLGAEQVGLDESMTQVPGAFLLNSYNYAQDLRVSIRGFGARSSFGIRGIKIIIDGIPESLPDGQGSIDGVDIGSIHQISVIRGPSSSLYGNASGGAILIDTERGSESPFIELQDIYGGFNLNKKQFKIGGEINKLNYLLNISDTSVDGYREHSEFKNKQFNGRFEYSLTDSSSIISTVHHTDQPLANDPGGVTYEDFLVNPKQARTQNLNFKAGEKIKQTRIGLLYKKNLDNKSELEVKTYYTDRDFSNKLPFEDSGIVNLDRNFSGGGFRYIENLDFFKLKNRLLFGLDFDRQDDNRIRYNNILGERGIETFRQNELITSLGAYLQNEIKINNSVEITFGLRYDDIEFKVSDKFLSDGNDSGQIHFNELSPMISLSLKNKKNKNIYTTISKAFETPTTTEFANPDGGGFNQSISPQKSTNYEIGYKMRDNDNYIETALFYIDVEDELTPFEDPNQPGRTFYTNAGSSDRHGLEIMNTNKINDWLKYSISYTYSNFKYDSFKDINGKVHDGNYAPGIPKHMLNIDLSWSNNYGSFANFKTMYSSEIYADNSNKNIVSSYSVSNINLGRKVTYKDLDINLFLGIKNIFNERYNNNIRINAFGGRFFEPAPKRNTYTGITLEKKF